MGAESIYLNDVGFSVWLKHLFIPAPGYSWDIWIGNWVAAILTLALFSFLVADNRVFKLAEHIFVGVATGYLFVRTIQDSIIDKLYFPFFNPPEGVTRDWWLIIPLVLGLMTFMKYIPSLSWGLRWPLAFYAGVGIGLAVVGWLRSSLISQIETTILQFRNINEFRADFEVKIRSPQERTLLLRIAEKYRAQPHQDRAKLLPILERELAEVVKGREWIPQRSLILHVAAHGLPEEDTFILRHRDWGRLINSLLIALGVFTSLFYFFFSVEQKGVLGGVSRVGIWFLMVAFGASFGYTVMARISLLIGRLQFLFGDWLHLQSILSSLPL